MNAMAASSELSLPPRLINFFARYPPRLYGIHFTGQSIPTIRQKITKEGNKRTGEAATTTTKATNTNTNTSTSTAPAAATATATSTPTVSSISEEEGIASIPDELMPVTRPESLDQPLLDPSTSQPIFDANDKPPNPFLPYRNPATGRWRGAMVSLRRQAELYKLARIYGVEPLLPASRKSTAFKETRLLERGLAVKGTGEGQTVKGHKWERAMGPMLQKRITAMEKMPELIREWRVRGNGRGWKKYPK